MQANDLKLGNFKNMLVKYVALFNLPNIRIMKYEEVFMIFISLSMAVKMKSTKKSPTYIFYQATRKS